MDTIGISVLEYISMATAVSGICWLMARRWRQRLETAAKKPLWVSWRAEMFGNGQPFQAELDRQAVAKPEDAGQVFVRETSAGRDRTIKVDARRPGAIVTPQAWLQAEPGACQVVSAQAWACKVPANRYLMMGDNRDNSSDSRVWGFLDPHEVYGKAVRVLVNFSDLKRAWTAL